MKLAATLALLAALASCGADDRVELVAVAPTTTAALAPVVANEKPLPRVTPTTRASRSNGVGGRAAVPSRAAARQPTTGPADVVATIHAVFGAAGDAAVRVARCESGLRADNRGNPTHAGLFQLARRWHEGRARRLGFTWEQMYEARPNAVVAHNLWLEGRDWHQWTCKP